ncbi:MAG: type II secretion system protein [Phycisphaeraceae bacterium]|nr:type II secretion system protein [Phycisphaeraceae bacterium]
MKASSQPNRTPRAFTLLELLVVITIIAILVSLTLATGTKVVSIGRERGTQWALQALDTSVGEYIQANGAIPAATVRDPSPNSTWRVPIIDGGVGKDAANLRAMDSTAWYVYQLQSEGSSALAAIHQIDARLRKTGIAKDSDAQYDESHTGTRTTQILDVWGNPIHYVHPRYGGVHGVGSGVAEDIADVLGTYVPGYGTKSFEIKVFSRDPAPKVLPSGKKIDDYKNDADGGAAPNRRPYFYSAGPDGDPSTTEDNIYTIRPNLPR